MEKDNNLKGRGSHVRRTWEEISKGAGESPSPFEIERYLTRSQGIQMSREEVLKRIQEYFASCTESYEDEDNGGIYYRWRRNPTKSGLARALGITAETLSHYCTDSIKGHPYYDTNQSVINRNDFDLLYSAFTVIQEFYEGNLAKNRNNSGSIFWLLNVGESRWTDTQTVKMVDDNQANTPSLTQEDIKQLANQARQDSIPELISKLPD